MISWTDASETLARLRERAPLVHSITNYVAMDVTANALLAIGASPVMAHAVEEVADIVEIADVLVVNIGTLSPSWVNAMETAIERARQRGKPWVLDPVGAGATAYRSAVARELSGRGPAVIRGNASEVRALLGERGGTRGVDSVHGSASARDAALELAQRFACVVAATGAVDYVADGRRLLAVSHGDELMTRVTALGCAATAIIGAFAALDRERTRATAQALGVFGLAGERAARDAAGPGTLRWRLLDALHTLDGQAVSGLRITEIERGG